jgi:hypothetical protein
MKIVTKPARETPPPKKRRSTTLLMLQISIGGCAGVAIALLVLKGLNVGIFSNEEPNKSVADKQIVILDREPNAPTPKPKSPTTQPGDRNSGSPNSANKPREQGPVVSTPSTKPKNKSTRPNGPLITSIPRETIDAKPERAPRMPIAKETLGAHLAKAKIPAAAQVWWSDRGAFEFDNTGSLRSIDFLGKKSHYLPMASTENYLEIESDSHQERIRLFLDHAEVSREPFETYEPLYPQGKWVVASDQTGVDWFPKAIVDLNTALHKSRTTAKEYMGNLFTMADKLKAANKLKDVPFGFDLNVEREGFTSRGLVPWSAPLLPMTDEYLQECRKLHKNEDAGYNRIAQRLTTQREKAAKDYLKFHQWKNARAWPIAVLSWSDGSSGKDVRYTLFSNGAVNDPFSKVGWKLTKDVLEVDIGERRVRLRIGATGKDFSVLGQEPPVTGAFVFDGEKLAF